LKPAAFALAGFVLGFSLQGAEVWICAACGTVLGILLATIFFATDFALRVARAPRSLDQMRADLPPWPEPPSEAL